MTQTLRRLKGIFTLDTQSYDLLNLKAKIPEKLQNRRFLDENMGQIYSELRYK